MGQVTVTFNNQDHHLACQDGGEERLKCWQIILINVHPP